jgi:hypothetical protein
LFSCGESLSLGGSGERLAGERGRAAEAVLHHDEGDAASGAQHARCWLEWMAGRSEWCAAPDPSCRFLNKHYFQIMQSVIVQSATVARSYCFTFVIEPDKGKSTSFVCVLLYADTLYASKLAKYGFDSMYRRIARQLADIDYTRRDPTTCDSFQIAIDSPTSFIASVISFWARYFISPV